MELAREYSEFDRPDPAENRICFIKGQILIEKNEPYPAFTQDRASGKLTATQQ